MKAFSISEKAIITPIRSNLIIYLFALITGFFLMPVNGIASDKESPLPLSCISNLQVTIGLNGYIQLTPQMLLVGSQSDYGIFTVDIEGDLTDTLTCSEVEQSFIVSVIDTTTQNSCWSTVYVEDKVDPILSCEDLDISCSIDYSDEDYSFFITVSDNCTAEENLDIWYNESVTNLNCDPDNAAIVQRTWYVTDEYGNQSSCEQTINIVKPDLADVVFPNDTLIYCPIPNTNPDSLGVPTIDGIPIDPFCEIVSWYIDSSSVICNGSSVITRTWNVMNWCDLTTVTDEQMITVLDTTPPVITCPDDMTLAAAPDMCGTQITLPVSDASDSCGEDSLIQIMIIIDGVPGFMEEDLVDLDVGDHVISYRATDDCGNVSTCSYNVEVIDTITPVLNCLAVVDISTGGDVNLAVDPAVFPHIYTDNCELADTLIRRVETHCNKPSDLVFGPGISFCCEDVTVNVLAEMLVIDASGNSNSCVFEIDFTETEPPTIVCKDTILYLDSNGEASVNTVELYTEIDDNCAVDTVVATINEFNCIHVGDNNVVVTVSDEQGNTGTCIAVVTIIDTMPPDCNAMDITIALDNSGNLSLTGQELDDNSVDECGIDMYSASPSDFDCSDIGTSTPVVLTVTDPSGNSSSCSAMVTIIDTTGPICATMDITIDLDINGTASITAGDVDDGSADECSGISLGVSPNSFDCGDLGDNIVVLTVTDDSGNTSTCTATVTVQDLIPPTAICQDITIQLDDAGNYTLMGNEIDNGSSDNCGIQSLVSVPGAIDCSDLAGLVATLTVTDVNGNTDECTSNVAVQDTTPPIALCQDITIVIDMSGVYNLGAGEVDGGSSDACDLNPALSVSPNQFMCDDLGDNEVTLTVTDASGNSSTCTAIVDVTELQPPMCVTQDITVYLDDSGNVQIDSNSVDNNSTDPCGVITEITVSPNSFDCSDTGDNNVVMTVTDSEGNSSTCSAIVTVQDTISPICLAMDITIQLDGSDMATITAGDVDNGSSDNCSIQSLVVNPNSFGCPEVGDNVVTLTVTDLSSNVSSCTSIVTVQDTTPPIAICQDLTVDLDGAGNASITAAQIDNGSNDNCSSVNLEIDIDEFFCNDVGDNTVILTVTDASGNSSTCSANVNVQDNINPTAVCQDITIQLDSNGEASINPQDIDGGSTDNCTIISLQASMINFTCANLGSNVVTLTVTDINANTGTCTADVEVQDTISPIAICQDITVQLDGAGQASITGVDVDGGSSDNCTLSSILPSPSNFDCNDLGNVNVTLTVIDNSGNQSTCIAVVTVEDTIPPIALCQDLTIYVDNNGEATLNPDDLDNNSTDNCNDLVFTASETEFDCSDLGSNDVTLYATDGSGNVDSCQSVVTVLDTVSPIAICQDITIQLDASGNASITGSDVDGGSTDNCGINSLSVNPSSFDCTNIGANPVILTVEDNSTNMNTCSAIVTVEDTVSPIAICQDITVQLDASGMASITPADVDNGSNDACGINNLSLDIMDFDCNDVGQNSVILTVEDNNSNTSTCSATVTVEDNIPPVALCQDITLQLDVNGSGSITGGDVDGGSTDACGIDTLDVDITDFTCPDVGANVVILTVTDNNGNIATCSAIVTVEDTISPVALCQDITVQLDSNGDVSIVPSDIDNGSTDACGPLVLSLDIMDFTCADIGDNPVILTVTDANSNSSTCSATVTVQDTTPPMALCQDITVDLDINGYVMINAAQVDNGSNDVCSGVSLSIDIDNFNCSNLGDNMVQLTVTDASGNSSTCSSTVTVEDNLSPNAICQDITIQLDVNGEASIMGEDINNGSTDNCIIISLLLDISDFDCNDLGNNNVILSVTDNSSNTGTCSATVTVEDTIPPIAICQDITVQLDGAGQAIITGLDVDGGSTDNCTIASLLPVPATFNCGDLGVNNVTLTVTDNSNNSSTCISSVTVQDTISPVAVCQDLTIFLDNTGNVVLNPDDLDNGSTDNCITLIFSADQTLFNCSNLGANSVELTATDGSGNTGTCISQVTVSDTVSPVALCQDITIQLDASGNASITGSDIDGGSTDNCSIANLSPNPSSFTCNEVGDNNVTLTVTDGSGNTGTCIAVVTVQDTVSPTALCQDITVQLDVLGMVSISADDVNNGSSDACGIANTSIDFTDFFCNDAGDNNVTLTVEDNNSNTSTCVAVVTVEDNIPPVAMCQDITIQLDVNGMATISGLDINNGSTDACIIVSLLPDIVDFDCSNVGDNNVILTVADASGNSSTCSSVVTVEDNIPPVALCQDITVQLDDTGGVSIVASDVDGGSTDACVPLSLSIDVSDFTCADIGANNVILTVTDDNGNSTTCSSTVTVEDNVPPVAVCQDITIQLDGSGSGTITANDIDNGSTDACGISLLEVAPMSFDCSNLGDNTVTLTVTDVNSNTSTCSATVTVEDNIAPTALCQDITVFVENDGDVVADVNDIDNGSFDNCNSLTLGLDFDQFDCTDIGSPSTVILTASDDSGNSSTCSATVTVEDTISPIALCQDITIQLDASGGVVITGLDINDGSSDNCGIALLVPTPQMFDCDDIGDNNVVLTVTDVNSNSSTCESTVTVEDVTPPVITCLDITVDIEAGGTVTVNAIDLIDTATDNCDDAADLIYTFEAGNPDSTAIVYTCDSLGQSSPTVFVEDTEGNSNSCVANVTINDGNNNCPIPFTGDIGGIVIAEFEEFLDDYQVELVGDNNSLIKDIESGPFVFEDVLLGQSYELSVSKDEDWKNGLSLMDYDMIVDHVIQRNIFESPYQYIAADLDNNFRISALDAVWLKRLILDYEDRIDGNESWKFINMYHEFESINPLEEELPEKILFDPLVEDVENADFLAIKMGDVNGDAQKAGFNGAETRNENSFIIYINEHEYKAGEEFNLELDLCQPECSITGVQLELILEGLVFNGFKNQNISASDFNYMEDENKLKLMFSKHDYNLIEIGNLVLQLTALEDGSTGDLIAVNSNLDFSTVFDDFSEPLKVNYLVKEREAGISLFTVAVAPNPFASECTIDLNLRESGKTQIEVFDIYGRLVYLKNERLEKGSHSILISASDLGKPGIYNVVIRHGDAQIDKKLIMIN